MNVCVRASIQFEITTIIIESGTKFQKKRQKKIRNESQIKPAENRTANRTITKNGQIIEIIQIQLIVFSSHYFLFFRLVSEFKLKIAVINCLNDVDILMS